MKGEREREGRGEGENEGGREWCALGCWIFVSGFLLPSCTSTFHPPDIPPHMVHAAAVAVANQ